MSSRIRNTHAGLPARKILLPAALALAFGPLAAHAATADWAPTRSHAALLKTVTTSPAAGRAAVTHTSYIVNRHGLPQVQSAVTPLDNTKALHVAVSLNLRNADQLQAFIKNVNTPGNPLFGKFLTPAQFKATYAPTDAQVQAVVAHLRKSGFTQVSVSPNNLLVFADGNASAASTAFNTTMKTYVDNGKQRFANDSDVMVPQALGGIVGSVIGLQNIEHKHPMNFLGRPVTQTAQATTQGTPVNVTHSPTEFPTIYNAGSTPTAFNTTVGIVTWGDLTQTQEDLATMTSAMAMAPVNVKVVPVTLGNLGEVDFSDDPNSDTEWNLDSQSIIGTSGGVKQLVFYTAANGKYGAADEELTDAGITAAYNQAVVDNLAKVINVSLGEDETIANQTGTQAADDAIFAQAVAQGQTFSVASGDQGVYVTTNGEFETNAGGPLAGFNPGTYSVSEPATSPYVIAVGGTELTTNGGAWAGETTWNDGVEDAGDGNNRIWASTGGKSLFETAPAWQAQQLGASVRQVPDIAFDASSYTGAQIFIGGQRYTVGGTSLASPIFVGVFARVQTYANNSIGFPASLMYRDFPSNAAVLHDVTTGNNGVSYQGKQYGYNAAAGWDFTTGYGSLDIGKFNQLAFTWGNGSPATTNPPVTPTTLTNGVTVPAQGQAGASTQFMLVVPGGMTTLSFRTAGGSGDVSMYVKRGSAASASSYDYMSARPNSNTESVVVRNPTAGVYYVTLTSPGVFTGVALLGSYQ